LNNSVLMIERHYSKLTATMAAEQLAWYWSVVLDDSYWWVLSFIWCRAWVSNNTYPLTLSIKKQCSLSLKYTKTTLVRLNDVSCC
jgi:hypothetical protein